MHELTTYLKFILMFIDYRFNVQLHTKSEDSTKIF